VTADTAPAHTVTGAMVDGRHSPAADNRSDRTGRGATRVGAGMAGGHMITVMFAATGHMVVDGPAT
jgi:hypothetical protein